MPVSGHVPVAGLTPNHNIFSSAHFVNDHARAMYDI